MPQETRQQLPQTWTVWFSYSCDTQSDVNYKSNLMKVQQLNTWDEFAYFWKASPVSKTDNYFINPETGAFKKYKFGIEQRKIDSISYFKRDIEPRWEHGQNQKYGYFNFGIAKGSDKVDQIYEATVFLALGGNQDISISEHINGIRIVDNSAKKKHPNRARIEIWVDFRHELNDKQESFNKLQGYKKQLEKYYEETIGEKILQMKFFNISTDEPQKKK